MKILLKPKSDKSLPFFLFVSFLTTFALFRLFVALWPQFYLSKYIAGGTVHIHHFAYGIILMSIIGTISIITNATTPRSRTTLAVLFGIALGLAYDEFAMWLELEDIYYDRRSYDAVIMVSLLFLNVIYFGEFWKRWSKRIFRLCKFIAVKTPRRIIKFFYK